MSKYSRLIFNFFILCCLLAACNLPNSDQDQVNSIISNTPAPLPPTATNTPPAPSPIPPTQTPIVLSKTITFRTDGTSSYHQESIKAGEIHTYSLQAGEGQTMILTVVSPDNDVFLGVKGLQDNWVLISTEDQSPYWTGTLPGTQDYLITLATNNPDTYYFLEVEIPAKIQFEPGSDSVTIDGYIDVHTDFYPDVITRVRYLVYANEGQTLTIELDSPNLDNLSIGVYGQEDGQRYIAYHVKNNGGELPVSISQGYYIDVYSTGGVSTDFTLDISIE